MRKLASAADKVWKVTSSVATLFLILNMVIIIANIIMRRFFNAPIFGSTEIVSYASLITAALALAQNEWFDGNIQMTLIVDMLPAKASKWLKFVDYIVCSGAFVFISYLMLKASAGKMAKGDYTQDLKMPIYIFSYLLTAGFIMLTICIIIKMVIMGYNAITGNDVKFVQRRAKAD